jgi:hypothetical protein
MVFVRLQSVSPDGNNQLIENVTKVSHQRFNKKKFFVCFFTAA